MSTCSPRASDDPGTAAVETRKNCGAGREAGEIFASGTKPIPRRHPDSDAIGMIAAGIGHDLNNLLMVLGNGPSRHSPSLAAEHDVREHRKDFWQAIETASTYARYLMDLGLTFKARADLNMRKSTDTGLGLALVRGIVDKAGGEIDFSSELGTGTVFKLALPLCET